MATQTPTTSTQNMLYMRVSSATQNLDRQRETLKHIDTHPDFVFEEQLSGASTDRPKLQELLRCIRRGDVVHVASIDRLARNMRDLLELVQAINDKGASVHFVKESLRFDGDDDARTSPINQLMLNLLGSVAEFERTLIKERQAEGIERAKAKGVYKGRKTDHALHESIHQHLASGLSIRQTASKVGCSTSTVQRVKALVS